MVQTALKKLPYKDIPAVTETYVDGFGSIQADDDGVRIILTVSRPDPPKKGSKLITGYNGTGARLHMPLRTMLELHTQLGGMIDVLIQQGILKGEPSGALKTLQ
jgi:hypothetical protein